MFRIGKKGNLGDFVHGIVVGARQTGLSISENADVLGFPPTTVSLYYRGLEKRKDPVGCSSLGKKVLLMADVFVSASYTVYTHTIYNLVLVGFTCLASFCLLVWFCCPDFPLFCFS